MDTLESNPGLKVSSYKIQRLVHDLAHENMEGQIATAHQAMYMTLGQDRMIEVNHRRDWWDVRNHLLQQLVDENTPGPGDGSISVTPAMRKPMEGREHGRRSNYESFQVGDGVTIKTQKNKPVEYGWIRSRLEPVIHQETPLNNTDTQRFLVELKKGGHLKTIDAKSLKYWRTEEKPKFLTEEETPQQTPRSPRTKTPTPILPPEYIQNIPEIPSSPGIPFLAPVTPPPTTAPIHQEMER